MTTMQVSAPRLVRPQNRYAMANGCYKIGSGAPFYFKATDLGTYLLYSKNREYLATTGTLGLDPEPSAGAEWTADQGRQRLRAALLGALPHADGHDVHPRQPAPRDPAGAPRGCTAFPSPRSTSADDPTPASAPSRRCGGSSTRHTHGMAFEFLGGDVHCGRPWHKYGVTVRPGRLPRPHRSPAATARPWRRSCPANPATTRSAGRPSRTGRRPTH